MGSVTAKVRGFASSLVLMAACPEPTMDTEPGSESSGGVEASSSGGVTGDPTPTEADASSSSADASSSSSSSSTTDTPTTDIEAVCGDSVVEGDEECDDGNTVPTDACLPGCKNAVCGDLVLQLGFEECDDGNQVDTDHCTNACQFAICGDGVVGPGEACDDGNSVDKDECTNECILATCGDGDIQPGEDCDEGVETPECNINCKESKCGDSVPNAKAGEACDDGGESVTCNADCSVAACGDGKINMVAGETCDDIGETAECNADCSVTDCGDGKTNMTAGEVCDDGGESAECNVDCTSAECGDGKVNATASEACDDAGESKDCNVDCSVSECGDGKINTTDGETCDDGNIKYGDLCAPSCTPSKQLAVGSEHVCALYGDNTVHCWGDGYYGKLGYGNSQDLGKQPGELPTAVVNVGGKVVQIAGGGNHTCARLESGKARCWGYYASVGYGNVNDSQGDEPGELPTADLAIDSDVVQIAAGVQHTCVVVEGGGVRCWGSGAYGMLGTGSSNPVYAPPLTDIEGISDVVQIAPGGLHTCALLSDGTVRCWGSNQYGQLGIGNTNSIGDNPGEMPPPKTNVEDIGDPVKQLAAGNNHTCALLASGKVRCWGYNQYGVLGSFSDYQVGDAPADMPPKDVPLGGPAVQVVAGEYHSCALMSTNRVKCWGNYPAHGYGNFSAIDTQNEFPPQDVSTGGNVESIFSGGRTVCAHLIDKKVRCWGRNDSGQLGQGNINDIGDNETPMNLPPIPL